MDVPTIAYSYRMHIRVDDDEKEVIPGDPLWMDDPVIMSVEENEKLNHHILPNCGRPEPEPPPCVAIMLDGSSNHPAMWMCNLHEYNAGIESTSPLFTETSILSVVFSPSLSQLGECFSTWFKNPTKEMYFPNCYIPFFVDGHLTSIMHFTRAIASYRKALLCTIFITTYKCVSMMMDTHQTGSGVATFNDVLDKGAMYMVLIDRSTHYNSEQPKLWWPEHGNQNTPMIGEVVSSIIPPPRDQPSRFIHTTTLKAAPGTSCVTTASLTPA